MSGNDCWNRNVFSRWWKVAIDGDDWTWTGNVIGVTYSLFEEGGREGKGREGKKVGTPTFRWKLRPWAVFQRLAAATQNERRPMVVSHFSSATPDISSSWLPLLVLTDCRVTFNTKILENSPPGDLLQTPMYTAYIFWKNTYCIKLYFEFDCLVFSPNFASRTEKFNFCSPNRKIVPAPMRSPQPWKGVS